jgi:hypothetical protein
MEYRGYSIGEVEHPRGARSWGIFPIRPEGNVAANRCGGWYASEAEAKAKVDKMLDERQERFP